MTRAYMSFLFSCSRYATCLRSVSAVLRRRLRLLARCRSPVGRSPGHRSSPVTLWSPVSWQRPSAARSLGCREGHIPPRWVRDVECPPSGIPSVAVHRSVWVQVQTLSLPLQCVVVNRYLLSRTGSASLLMTRGRLFIPSVHVRSVLCFCMGSTRSFWLRQFQRRGGSKVFQYFSLLGGFVWVFVRIFL